jgi:pilus assembly protein CpaB
MGILLLVRGKFRTKGENMANRKIMVISLIFGIITFFITTLYLGNVSKEQKYRSELLNVVVAKGQIPARTILTRELLEIKKIPREYVLAGAYTNLNEPLNKVTLAALLPGEQLTGSKLTEKNKQLGLALIIPKDKRAVSVEVDASASIAGLIKPGDMVDVVCTIGDLDRTVTILQNVPVLAIDQQMESGNENKNEKVNRTVIATFALNLTDAEKLVQASAKGQLKLLLRPLNDETKINSWGSTTSGLLPYYTGSRSGGWTIRIIRGANITNKTF